MALDYESAACDAVYIALALQRQTPLLTAELTTSPWVLKLVESAELFRQRQT